MADRIVDMADFSKGFFASTDTTKAPFGSLRKMRNAQVTERGGLAPRPGTVLLGAKNDSIFPSRGLYAFKKSFEENEILVKNYDDEMEGFSLNHPDQGWFRIKNGFTPDKEFGYVHSLFNTSNENLLVGGNRYEKFFSYNGSIMTLTGALAGAETTITVDSTLVPDVYESKTATGSSTTTLTVTGAAWGASQWNSFYVHITSGAQLGQIRAITATTADTITFTALPGDPGTCTFEVRRLLLSALTGSIIYNGTVIAYTGVPTSTTITVASAHAAPTGTIVTQVPTEYENNPRGNRFTNYLGRLIVGNVRSALARNSGGALQGSASGSAAFVSKINNPLDYGFAATRVASEGDMISLPYGGGPITDVVAQENTAYLFKRDYIEAIVYSQDEDDLAIREPLKPGAGSVGKTTRGKDDLYFFTESKEFSSIGRVRSQDIRPQTQDIGFSISRWLEQAGVDEVGRGVEVAGKIYIPLKSSTQSDNNDVILIYNRNTNSFEGIWDVAAFGLVEFGGKYYYASSNSPDVYQLFHPQNVDIEGETQYGYTFEVATHFFNLTAAKGNLQAMHGIVLEGYIRGGTTITYNIWKDFSDTPSVTINLSADEEGYLDGDNSNIFLGDAPLGLNPMSIDFSDIDADGRRHFMARVYFPHIYCNYVSVGMSSSGVFQDHETLSLGIMIQETPAVNQNRIKNI
jgi:hypothetical protein